jgi:hypothetical protein
MRWKTIIVVVVIVAILVPVGMVVYAMSQDPNAGTVLLRSASFYMNRGDYEAAAQQTLAVASTKGFADPTEASYQLSQRYQRLSNNGWVTAILRDGRWYIYFQTGNNGPLLVDGILFSPKTETPDRTTVSYPSQIVPGWWVAWKASPPFGVVPK